MTPRPVRPPVSAVIFDWGGTLTPWHTVDVGEQWRVFAGVVHDDEDAAAALAAEILAAEHAAWARGRADHSSARMSEILAEAGYDDGHEAHEDALTAYQRFWEPHTLTDPQVKPLWESLRALGLRIGVLSNTIWTREYHREVFERDGVLHLVDGDVYSSELDHVKPHPQPFRAAAAAVGVPPEEVVYVGDRMFEDVHGAHQAGMRVIWIPHSQIPHEQRVDVDAIPDARAHELMDVLEIVTAWCAGA